MDGRVGEIGRARWFRRFVVLTYDLVSGRVKARKLDGRQASSKLTFGDNIRSLGAPCVDGEGKRRGRERSKMCWPTCAFEIRSSSTVLYFLYKR